MKLTASYSIKPIPESIDVEDELTKHIAKVIQVIQDDMDASIIRQLSLQSCIKTMGTKELVRHLSKYPTDRDFLKELPHEVEEILKVKDL